MMTSAPNIDAPGARIPTFSRSYQPTDFSRWLFSEISGETILFVLKLLFVEHY